MVSFRPVAAALLLALCGLLGAALVPPDGPGVVVGPVDTRGVAGGSGAPTLAATGGAAPAAALLAGPTVAATGGAAPATAAPPGTPAAVEPVFLAHMTTDDVARGVYALAAADAPVALTADQRAEIAPLLRDAAAFRTQLGELRTARRAARDAWLADGAGMAAVVGPERLRGAARGADGARPPAPDGARPPASGGPR